MKGEEGEASISLYFTALILTASFPFHMIKAQILCKLCSAIFSESIKVEYSNLFLKVKIFSQRRKHDSK